jgi:nucleoside-triphosphatase
MANNNPVRIAVSGPPGIGKSTLVQKVAGATKARVGGVLARDKRYKERRLGFELLDLGTGEVGMLADEAGDGPQLGKYRVHLGDLDTIGAAAVEKAVNYDLIIIDEIGPMELASQRFIMAVEKALLSSKPMLVVLHQWSNHRLAKKIRNSFRVIEVTKENRDALVEEIAKEFKK